MTFKKPEPAEFIELPSESDSATLFVVPGVVWSIPTLPASAAPAPSVTGIEV